jgi:hypothetical protein
LECNNETNIQTINQLVWVYSILKKDEKNEIIVIGMEIFINLFDNYKWVKFLFFLIFVYNTSYLSGYQ